MPGELSLKLTYTFPEAAQPAAAAIIEEQLSFSVGPGNVVSTLQWEGQHQVVEITAGAAEEPGSMNWPRCTLMWPIHVLSCVFSGCDPASSDCSHAAARVLLPARELLLACGLLPECCRLPARAAAHVLLPPSAPARVLSSATAAARLLLTAVAAARVFIPAAVVPAVLC
jgi:hypothetical protein